MKPRKKKESPLRIDFNTTTREIIEIFQVSTDGSKVRTSEGWVSAYRKDVIVQRPTREGGFMSADQIERANKAEQELLKEKKFKHTAAFQVAVHYPIARWLQM